MAQPRKETKDAGERIARAGGPRDRFLAEAALLASEGWRQESPGLDSPDALFHHPDHGLMARWAAVRCCLAELALSMLEKGKE